MSSDGRHRRRERNAEAVRQAALEMLETDEQVTTDSLSARSGVAVRTIYRHFGGAAGAIDDAVRSRLDEVSAIAVTPNPDGTVEERIAGLVAVRLGCLKKMLPVLAQSGPLGAEIVDERLTADVERCFDPELSAMADADRRRAVALLTLSLRFSSLDYLLAVTGSDHDEVAVILDAQLRHYITPFSNLD